VKEGWGKGQQLARATFEGEILQRDRDPRPARGTVLDRESAADEREQCPV
jgi:hypothetical protein